ncbi:hypothetical protein GOODEAATRI_012963 [Goodea atripinnis]|uniref:Secreted protein n=1 Tax=Goodea atripinnis TaxID=208336 RepID=A0ABV0N314_9TELE
MGKRMAVCFFLQGFMPVTPEAPGEPCKAFRHHMENLYCSCTAQGQNFHPSRYRDRGHVSRKPHLYFHTQK